jgi:tight adherence protein B
MFDETLLTVLLAAMSVAMLVWGLGLFVGDAVSNERKKLHQRLAGESRTSVEMERPFTAVKREVVLEGVSGVLVRFPGMAALHHAIEQTWPTATLAKFLATAAGLAAGGFFIALAILNSLLLGIAVGVVAGAMPFFVLSSRRAKRQRALVEQLPEALDFLGRILRAGHSLTTGLQMVGEELPEPLAGEFRRAYETHSLGRSLDDALKEASLRIASTDFGFFVTAVLIQRQTGGDLAEVLDNISEMIRGRMRLQQHVRAKTSEGRFTGYILTAFPVVMFFLSYALNPGYAGVLLEGTGLYLLGTAGALCVVGLLVIRRITSVRV